MCPDERAELELLVAAHMPSISGRARERLLVGSAFELGRQQGSRQAVRKSLATAAVSCALTLFLSWAVMPGVRSGLSTAADAVPGANLPDRLPPRRSTVADATANNTAQRIAASHSAATPASPSPFDQHILTPRRWSARWEVSRIGELNAESVELEPADGASTTDRAAPRRAVATPFRAGMPLDQL